MIFAAGCRARAGQGLADAAQQEGEPVQVLAQRRGAIGGVARIAGQRGAEPVRVACKPGGPAACQGPACLDPDSRPQYVPRSARWAVSWLLRAR